MFNLSEIANILQIGFSGFAFLLAAMSYMLLQGEVNRKEPARKPILQSISNYTKYTFSVAIIVILSKFGEKYIDYYFEYKSNYQNQTYIQNSISAQKCRGSMQRLIHAETKVNTDYKSLLQAIQEATSNCESTLESLSK